MGVIPKRKDSGFSVYTAGSDDAAAPKTRDFALKEKHMNMDVSKNTPRKLPTAAITIKAGKDNESVWRRLRVTACSKLGGKA